MPSEKLIPALLQKTLSRRELLQRGAALSLIHSLTPETEGNTESVVPASLADVFSLSPEYLNTSPRSIKDTTFVEGELGVMAMFTLLSDNSLEKMTLDRNRGVYMVPEEKSKPPMDSCQSIVAMPSNEVEIGKEVAVAGGYDIVDFSTPMPKIAATKDGGNSYESARGIEKIQNAAIVQMKRIPRTDTDKVLVLMNNVSDSPFTYGVYDTGSNEFTPVAGNYEAPFITELYVNDRNRNMLSGSGIGLQYTLGASGPEVVPAGINDFEIDLKSNTMISSLTHHLQENISHNDTINSVFVERDYDGRRKTERYLRLIIDDQGSHGIHLGRYIHTIDMEKDMKTNSYSPMEYGWFMDMKLREKTGKSSTVLLSQIMKTEGGFWVAGTYFNPGEQHPLIAHWPLDADPINNRDQITAYTFDDISSPSIIAREPEPVRFYEKTSMRGPSGIFRNVAGTRGIVCTMENVGHTVIRTDGRDRPAGLTPLYDKKGEQMPSASKVDSQTVGKADERTLQNNPVLAHAGYDFYKQWGQRAQEIAAMQIHT